MDSRALRGLMAASMVLICAAATTAEEPARLNVLFLGDNGHHQPLERAADLVAPLAKAGINLTYTDDLADLNRAYLDRFDALVIYANHEKISPDQEKALLSYVSDGHGLVALHCASYCFLNSPKYVELIGGQFKQHETGVFRAKIVKPDHPAMRGVAEFEAWDETYTHHRVTNDREVLMVRTKDGGDEPWTWVRKEGKGRVFYTASGHDERVFRLPAYHQLVIQGIRWASGHAEHKFALPVPGRLPADLPNYVKGAKWGVTGAAIKDMQEPLSPADSQRHLSVAAGLHAELFAAEPEIVKPIAIAWDRRGRAFIAETTDYPNNKQPDGKGHDQIKICEDTDGDGRADKFTVFATGLSIPTSIVCTGDGVLVSQAPDVLLLRDTDGDDRADERRVLFTGFSTQDTHAGPSNLRLGLDGWIYATVGYAGFEGKINGKARQFRQGLFRFKPDGKQLEFLTSASNNLWGLGFSEAGDVLYSTANGEHSSQLALPNRDFERVRGWVASGNSPMADHEHIHPLTTIRQVDHFDGFTAAAGHALYTARALPSAMWNRAAFVCEPTGHLVHWCQLEPKGSGFVSHDRMNLLASTDEWTAPIAAEVGPDGAIWVLDWYNYVVQHNPTPEGFKTGKGNAYETPLRDKQHGRIYRLVSDAKPAKPQPALGDEPAALVAALSSDNMFWRLAAQWRIAALHPKGIEEKLVATVGNQKCDAIGECPGVLHALWTLEALGAFEKPDQVALLDRAAKHPAPGVRRAAVELLARHATADRVLASGLIDDANLQVRRAALEALGQTAAHASAGAAVCAALLKPENAADRWIAMAATSAAARQQASFLPAALKTAKPSPALITASGIVAQHAAREGNTNLLELLGPLAEANPELATTVIDGFATGWPADKPPQLDAGARKQLLAVLRHLPAAGKARLAKLAVHWKLGKNFDEAIDQLAKDLLANVDREELNSAARIAAAREVVQLRANDEVLSGLLDLVSARSNPELAAGLLDAVAQSTEPGVGPQIVEHWSKFTPALRRQAVEVLLRRKPWTVGLLDGMDKGTIGAVDLAADQAQRLQNYPDVDLAKRARTVLEHGGLLPNADRQAVLAELMPITEKHGTPQKGLEAFKKICAKCHRHGEIGEKIGPNLTGFNVHPKSKILGEIIDPSRSVEGNFRQYTVQTRDGRVLSGLLASESATAIELVDTEAKRHPVLREDIEEMAASPKSIMPEGIEKQLSRQELTDLLEFLTAHGKYLPLPLDHVANSVSTRGMFVSRDADAERLIFPDWNPKLFHDIPFLLVDPQGDRRPNAVMLYGPQGTFPPEMPKSVNLECHVTPTTIHFLSGVSGWGYPYGEKGSVSMIVRLHFADGKTEDHPLRNGEQFADYIRQVDVPGSLLAFKLRGQQIRYFSVVPERKAQLDHIELVKGPDNSAPVVMAVTVETAD